MAIEAGARAGMIARMRRLCYLADKPMAPKGEVWDQAVAYWRSLPSDAGAKYDTEVVRRRPNLLDGNMGHRPEDALAITASILILMPRRMK